MPSNIAPFAKRISAVLVFAYHASHLLYFLLYVVGLKFATFHVYVFALLFSVPFTLVLSMTAVGVARFPEPLS